MSGLHSRNIQSLIMIALVMLFALSCGGQGDPISPDPSGSVTQLELNTRNARAPVDLHEHNTWGVYTLVIDQDALTAEVLDNRELALHLNVRKILQSSWWCPAKNCIQIQFLNIDEPNGLYTIKGTLVNPTNFNGYDVRVIIFLDEKGHQLLNADDYTMLYEEEDDINPFRSYMKNADNRKFASYSTASEIFEMYIPPVPKKFKIDFAIDTSFPTNCIEPYDLNKFGYEGSIYPDNPGLVGIDQGTGTVFTEVYDWQQNISDVTVDTTPITGGLTHLDYNPDLNRYEAVISDLLDAPPGDYVCLIAAYSEDDPNLGLYNYVTITVDETPPPALQTISGHVGDAFFLKDLDGTTIIVVNQDALGFSPDPVNVVGGEYLVNVVTGTYDISVISDDLVHYDQVCWNVEVTEGEDVKINFGLHNPTLVDPYEPFNDVVNWPEIMGFAGRVVDDTGFPISGATVEITSPDYWTMVEGQDMIQSEVTDDDGYFSIMNLPITVGNYGMPLYITQYFMHVRAEGYSETVLGPLPAQANNVPYKVISLTPYAMNNLVWSEGFETDSGWTMTGFYHRQMYDPGIKNISFDPTYNFIPMPPDETIGGSMPYPVEGQYYLWYGLETDGNFLGSYDPYQGSYTGGISDYEHSGYAISPAIDLTGYTEARVEFDMCYDIESQSPAGFDVMWFYITEGVNDDEIRFFNPFTNPGPREYTYSQRGYNRTVIWCHYAFDISSHAGSTINLKFDFSTDDNLYNGARGQFIDNVKVFAE